MPNATQGWSRDNSGSVKNGIWAGNGGMGSIPGRAKILLFHYKIPTGSGAHAASHTMDTDGCFRGDKSIGV